jgi:hypothetical protein
METMSAFVRRSELARVATGEADVAVMGMAAALTALAKAATNSLPYHKFSSLDHRP